MKTKYRIITKNGVLGKERFLQFNFNGWRYVPEQLPSYVHGRHLDKKSCPRSLMLKDKFDFKHCDELLLKASLISFTKVYIDIDEYFDHLGKLRSEYLEEEKLRESNKLPDTYYLQ